MSLRQGSPDQVVAKFLILSMKLSLQGKDMN